MGSSPLSKEKPTFALTKLTLRDNLNKLVSGESKYQLPERLGVPYNTLYQLLNVDINNPKVQTLIPMARYFNLTIDQLIGLDPLPNKAANEDELLIDYGLFKDCVCEINSLLTNTKISELEAFSLTKQLYDYCKKNSKLDKTFAQWLIEQNSA